MRNKNLNQVISTILLASIFLVSCNENKIKNKNNHKTAEVNIYSDSLALYTTFDSLIKVENIITNKNLYKLKIKNDQTTIPSLLIEKNNYLYFPFNETLLNCVNFRTKKRIWKFNCEGTITSLKNVNDSIILIGVRGYGIIALNTITGNKLYQQKDSNKSVCNSSSMYDLVFDEKLFFVSDSYCNNVTAFNFRNGKKIWGYKSKLALASRPILIKKFIFVGITGNPMKNEGKVVLLDKCSGKIIFEKNEPFDLITKPVLYKNKVIYYTYDFKLNEFDLDTKTTKVIYQFKEDEFGCGYQFFLKGDNIYFDDCKFNLNRFSLKTHKIKILGKSKSSLLGIYKNKNKIRFLY
jgi:outer membrane protein assembly factor BamB